MGHVCFQMFGIFVRSSAVAEVPDKKYGHPVACLLHVCLGFMEHDYEIEEFSDLQQRRGGQTCGTQPQPDVQSTACADKMVLKFIVLLLLLHVGAGSIVTSRPSCVAKTPKKKTVAPST